jgi:predicted phosphate transport protein (TIGR00153 family)
MARKKDENYFGAFVELVQYSCDAAKLLNEIVTDFKVGELEEKMGQIHNIEQAGDGGRHRMMEKLAREFITPIEREDIVAMADAIDNVTDTIEDVMLRIYMFNFTVIRKDAIEMAEIIIKCCEALKEALQEFSNFRKSQILHKLLVDINHLEEEGDRLFVKAIRNLFVNEKNPVEILAWRETLDYMEKCCDACEDVSEVIESVMMKNS